MADKTKEQYVSDGLDYFVDGKTEEAVKAYQAAIALDETFVEAHLALGKLHEFRGDLDGAIRVLRNAAELCPTEPLVHTSLSQCLQKKGLIPEAEEEMAIAFQLQRSGR